ncbi:hypothetical protein Misp01_53290 [Microtetraspora sp. NBRC 13810]|uniref:hypothetical protein n=1 Tax=Microtetraspora sp. NBRC 13810 TaxID=3030990 RepID=UPI00255465A2|nr:hypothetical protein [Microtetraspora sp. NBRC 13810]GLW10201.1 hypothetical protein Misp01_53290 [Microtetraspora sp. NBRC 13810]
MRIVRLLTVPVAVALAVAGLAAPVLAHTKPGDTLVKRQIEVRRHHPDVPVPIVVRKTGEAVIDLTASAPGTDWAVAGAESAVVSISVDNRRCSARARSRPPRTAPRPLPR